MVKNKTAETENSVTDFINLVENEVKRNDSFKIIELLKNLAGFEPKMWGPSIIGFGSYHYKYDSGHEGDAPLVAFSPRKEAIVLYFSSNYENKNELLEKSGKHKSSKACVYIKKLDDIDIEIFKEMTAKSIEYTKNLYPN